MTNIDRDTASAGGFGKMLTSLQGLQQRLEDFSIADVANAEANAHTLILRLRQVNDAIASVALLKQATADIDRTLEQRQQANLEAVELASLENHPQLHAIVNASKLIKLHRLMTALKAGADIGETSEQEQRSSAGQEPLDDEPSMTGAGAWADNSDQEINQSETPSSQNLIAEPTSAAPTGEVEASATPAELSKPEWNAETASPIIEIDDAEAVPSEELTANEFPTAEAEFADAVAAGLAPSSPLGDALTEDFPASEDSFNAALIAPAKLAATFPEPSDAREFAERDAIPMPVPVTLSGTRSNNDGKALMPANESFDLRLLDDLVSNYGEFAANPNLPATTSASAKSELEVFIPAAETAESAPLKAQAPQPVESEPAEPASLPMRNTGELDRQLKKIIKDYGQYDLYSDKPKTNLKKAGIIAFVFLGLVFGGIYFFKTPPTTAKTAPAPANIETGASGAESNSQAGAEPGESPKQTNLRQKN